MSIKTSRGGGPARVQINGGTCPGPGSGQLFGLPGPEISAGNGSVLSSQVYRLVWAAVGARPRAFSGSRICRSGTPTPHVINSFSPLRLTMAKVAAILRSIFLIGLVGGALLPVSTA